MHVGVCSVDLLLPENHSLKGKRRVLRRIKDRVRNTFNVSIAEVSALDSWQHSTLGIACVSGDRPQVERQLSRVVDFIDGLHVAVIADIHTEIL
jgi:hypothetical protein